MKHKKDDCIKTGCIPGMWMRIDFNMQERRCIHCNMILVKGNIPDPKEINEDDDNA